MVFLSLVSGNVKPGRKIRKGTSICTVRQRIRAHLYKQIILFTIVDMISGLTAITDIKSSPE